jgi:hypothetical protein
MAQVPHSSFSPPLPRLLHWIQLPRVRRGSLPNFFPHPAHCYDFDMYNCDVRTSFFSPSRFSRHLPAPCGCSRAVFLPLAKRPQLPLYLYSDTPHSRQSQADKDPPAKPSGEMERGRFLSGKERQKTKEAREGGTGGLNRSFLVAISHLRVSHRREPGALGGWP